MERYVLRRFLLLLLPLMLFLGAAAQRGDIRSRHKVVAGETLFGISKRYGVTVEELKNANPEMKTEGYQLKADYYINIPFAPNSGVSRLESGTQQAAGKTVRVGVMLPLHDVNGDGKRMVEYYRGLLLACDRLRKDNISVDMRAWNVPEDADIRMTLLENGADKCNVIFGPLYSKMVKPLADFCKKHDIRMVIPFSITGGDVKNYGQIFQVWQSADVLNERLVNCFMERFAYCHPVFIDCGDANSDKGAFTAALRKKLDSKKTYFNLTSLGSADADFAKAFSTDLPNVVILNTGSSPALNSTFAKLNSLKATHPRVQISMLGYTEWFMYTEAFQDYFYKYDVYVPTTYYYNPLSTDTRWVETNYRNWFHTSMMHAIPRFALTGFDQGCFFIGGIAKYGKAFDGGKGQPTYKAVQTPLRFQKEGKGRQNNTFMFIHYKTDRSIEAINY